MLDGVRAGSAGRARVEIENAGTAAWQSHGTTGILLAYHWLDERGNAIVWDGIRTELPHSVEPGTRASVDFSLRGPIPPGRYRLAVDLVDEGRVWFGEIGSPPLESDVDVAPRIERRLAARGGDREALAAQEEPLVAEAEAEAIAYLSPGVAPAPDWSQRVLDAHQEGYAVVGGSVEWSGGLLSRRPSELDPWSPGSGRVPGFGHPLVCPSIVVGVEPRWEGEVAGLPGASAPDGEPSIYDGRIVVTARPRSGRPRG